MRCFCKKVTKDSNYNRSDSVSLEAKCKEMIGQLKTLLDFYVKVRLKVLTTTAAGQNLCINAATQLKDNMQDGVFTAI